VGVSADDLATLSLPTHRSSSRRQGAGLRSHRHDVGRTFSERL